MIINFPLVKNNFDFVIQTNLINKNIKMSMLSP